MNETLFTYRPEEHARRSDPSTSHAAAEQAGSLALDHSTRIRAVLNSSGLTAEEIGNRCGLDSVAVNRRLAAMERQGLAVRTGERRKQSNGRSAQTWREA